MCAGRRGDASSRGGTLQHPIDASTAFCSSRWWMPCMRRCRLSRYIYWSVGKFFQREEWRYMTIGRVSGYGWNRRSLWHYFGVSNYTQIKHGLRRKRELHHLIVWIIVSDDKMNNYMYQEQQGCQNLSDNRVSESNQVQDRCCFYWKQITGNDPDYGGRTVYAHSNKNNIVFCHLTKTHFCFYTCNSVRLFRLHFA